MSEIEGLILIILCLIVMIMMYIADLQWEKEMKEYYKKNGLEWEE